MGSLVVEIIGAEKPNIVIIYTDDLGYGDLSCYGHPTIRTPNLDRMAREGMRFTDYYSVAEVCTPSRAALLTGRYPVRSGMAHDTFRVLRNRSKGHLPESEITIAESLKTSGYATGMIGKWHLGVWSINPAAHPLKHGFDWFLGLPHSNDMDPRPDIPRGANTLANQHEEWWNSPLYRNERIIEQPVNQRTLTKRYTDEAVKYIRSNKSKPFFLYLAHTFPHTPLFASQEFRNKSRRGLYGDVVEELDWSVGQILDALKREGIARRTLVFFTSDNGPWLPMNQQGGSAGLLRDGKGSTWEGGMRVPAIAWWPGKIKPGTVQPSIVTSLDLFPTALSLAKARLPADRELDGSDLSGLLLRNESSPRQKLFYYRGTQIFAVRKDNWKLHTMTQKGYGQPRPETHQPPLLFDLNIDPGEHFNVATNHPGVVADLLKEIESHRIRTPQAPSQLIEVVPVPTLTLERRNHDLIIKGPHLPGSITINYLEAYCRANSTDADWVKHTMIHHSNTLISMSPNSKVLKLKDTLKDGVVVDHTITAGDDDVTFELTAHNPTQIRSEAHWAQPCVRLSEFLGLNPATAGNATDYLAQCFIFLDQKLTALPTRDWATAARYVPGQTWCPAHVPRTDVNPRPLSPLVPDNGLIGAWSADRKLIFATAWEPYQELFQGVIRCLHSDFRLGGLKPGETLKIKGKIYLMEGDVEKLLNRYEQDFPTHPKLKRGPDVKVPKSRLNN